MKKGNKAYDVMMDLEALSIYCDGVILSISCVPFRFEDNNSFQELMDRSLSIKLDVSEQFKAGFGTTKDTLEWWAKQSPEAKKILKPLPTDLGIQESCDKMDEFFGEWYDMKDSYLYTRGIQYDFCFFQNLYRRANRPIPINTWNLMDTKTIIRMLTFDRFANYKLPKDKLEGFVKHDSLSDACKEVLVMQDIGRVYYGL